MRAFEFMFDEEMGRWVVSTGRFESAGVMHISNEMMWPFGLLDATPEVEITANRRS